MANKATPSHTEKVLTAHATNLSTSSPNHEPTPHDSHGGTQQSFRFMELPPELRDIIYTLAMQPEINNLHGWGYIRNPDLLAGLSNSTTARALSKVCRTIRHESMKAYYSKNTFVVRGVPDPWGNYDPMPNTYYPGSRPPKPGCPPPPDPLHLWARTWGVLGAQHIRSLDIGPLGGLVQICMTGEAEPVSVVQGTGFSRLRISASEVHAAALTAFGTSSLKGIAAAWKLNRFFYELGVALRAADERLRFESLLRRRDS
jgi:hypothetical protein